MHPGKHQTEIGKHQQVQPTMSENYADVKGKRCVIVDDVITTGSTMEEAIKLIDDLGGETVAIAVMLDKRGAETIGTVPCAVTDKNRPCRVTRRARRARGHRVEAF